MTAANYAKLWALATGLAIPSRLGMRISNGARRRARRAELQLRRWEHAWLAERDWMHALALSEGRVSVRDPAPVSRSRVLHHLTEGG